MPQDLLEQQRREVFRTLVELQDQGYSPKESRNSIGEQFAIALRDIEEVEREGIAKQWPPL
jgi:hypothetical protein